jgi:hypothetical protein
MALLPKAIYMFNAVPIKFTVMFITETKKINPRVHLETQKARSSQGNTEQKTRLQVSQYLI